MMWDSTVAPQSEKRYLSDDLKGMRGIMVNSEEADDSDMALYEALCELMEGIEVDSTLRPYDFRELLASGILKILGLEDYKSFASKYTIKWGELEVHPIHWTRNIEGLLAQFYTAYERFFVDKHGADDGGDFNTYVFPDYTAAPEIVDMWKEGRSCERYYFRRTNSYYEMRQKGDNSNNYSRRRIF
ncbi:MAG: hypothetical protein Q4D57_06715 [Clostridia bacterium]|nr:hypothetical protein [Clostridia bacterium]